MPNQKFEDLAAFKCAVELLLEIYRVTEEFPKREIYGLASQIRRAAVSVVSQIAEGQGLLSDGEWRQFLSQARGSLYEIEAQVIACHRLGYFSQETAEEIRAKARSVGRPLAGLIRYVRKREAASKRPGNRQLATGN